MGRQHVQSEKSEKTNALDYLEDIDLFFSKFFIRILSNYLDCFARVTKFKTVGTKNQKKKEKGKHTELFTLVITTIRLTLNKLSFPKNRDPYKKQKKQKKTPCTSPTNIKI